MRKLDNNGTSNKLSLQLKQEEREKKALELQREFSFEGYQVVRRELFSHMRDPAVIIRPTGLTFNKACINGIENVTYVHLMINPEKKYLVARKCDENEKDSIRWCKVTKDGERLSRKVTSKMFCKMLYELMHWDHRCRYKILGYNIEVYDERIFIFDLSDTEIFIEDKQQVQEELLKEGMTLEEINALVPAKGLPKPFYPQDWKKSFGLPMQEHSNALKIDDMNDFVPASDIQQEDAKLEDQKERNNGL